MYYTDVWGPFSTSASDYKFFASFIDDCTRVSWIYLLQSKSDVIHIISQFFFHTSSYLDSGFFTWTTVVSL